MPESDVPKASSEDEVPDWMASSAHEYRRTWMIFPQAGAIPNEGKRDAHGEPAISESRLDCLSRELIAAGECERSRLMSSLREGIGHDLACLKERLETLYPDQEHRRSVGGCERILEILTKTMAQTRSPIPGPGGLSASPEDLGVVLSKEGESISRQCGIRFVFRKHGEDSALDEARKNLLVRCVRELMHNVVKHAKASEISLSLGVESGNLVLVLRDNGAGFDISKLRSAVGTPGFGLSSIRESLAGIMGTMEVRTRIGGGTGVFLAVPLRNPCETWRHTANA